MLSSGSVQRQTKKTKEKNSHRRKSGGKRRKGHSSLLKQVNCSRRSLLNSSLRSSISRFFSSFGHMTRKNKKQPFFLRLSRRLSRQVDARSPLSFSMSFDFNGDLDAPLLNESLDRRRCFVKDENASSNFRFRLSVTYREKKNRSRLPLLVDFLRVDSCRSEREKQKRKSSSPINSFEQRDESVSKRGTSRNRLSI